MAERRPLLPQEYEAFLKDLKDRIRTAEFRAALAVNRELVLLYWSVGRDILARQKHGWGARVIDGLAEDLRREFPKMTGLSPRNLKYMRALAEAYSDEQFVQQVVAQIPWGHNVRILDHVGGQEFRLDLLFYHLRLRAFVVIELKLGEFQPEFTGKMNFYLSAIDDLLRQPDDNPSIGIIICKSKNNVVAEYALRDLRKPVGISEYRLTEALPKRLRGSLPTIEELEAELKREEEY